MTIVKLQLRIDPTNRSPGERGARSARQHSRPRASRLVPRHSVLELILEQVINGLLVGTLYIVLSLGLSLIFSLGGVVNLAHGAFYAVGAYLAYEVEKRAGFFGAVVVSPVLVACIGIAIERLFLSRLYSKDPALGLLFTFGLAMAAEQALRMIWGTTGLPFSIPDAAARPAHRRRFHLLLLSPDDPRCCGSRRDRMLAAAQPHRVRTGGASRRARSRDGARARYQPEAGAGRHLRTGRGARRAGRRHVRAARRRAAGDGNRDPHRDVRRGGDRRARLVLGRGRRRSPGRRRARAHGLLLSHLPPKRPCTCSWCWCCCCGRAA